MLTDPERVSAGATVDDRRMVSALELGDDVQRSADRLWAASGELQAGDGFEVDEELTVVSVAEGDETGGRRCRRRDSDRGVGLVRVPPRPPAVGGMPTRRGVWSWRIPEQLDTGLGRELGGDELTPQ
ncbi:MAG: hypothetical protein AB7R77_03615 [Ilumatobacteraceae bacterium]